MRKFLTFLLALLVHLVNNCYSFDVDDVTYDKMPPLFTLEDYNKCLLYNGTYCMIKVELNADPSNDLFKLLKNYTLSSHISRYNHTYLEKGLCVPKTCRNFIGNRNLDSPSELQEVLDLCQNTSIYEEYGIEAKVSDIYYCKKPGDEEKANVVDWLVLSCILLIIIVNIAGTVYDFKLDANNEAREMLSKGESMLLCFSLRNNWEFLVKRNKTYPNIPNLGGISFIRVVASSIMVMGHVVWIYTMGFIDNPHDFERAYNLWYFEMIFNGMIVVQIFFVISGFLLMFGLNMMKVELNWKNMATILKMRIVRLTPSLAVMLLFTSTWLRFMGSGPLWDRHVMPIVNDCRRWWWTHLLFINNYVQQNKYCAIQTWHIGADTQLFLAFLAILTLTKRKNRLNVLYILFPLSFLPPALHVIFQDIDAMLIKNPEFLRTLEDPNFGGAYVFGHNSISCFVLGLITACKLEEWLKKGIVFKGKVFRVLFWLGMPVIMSSFLAGSMFYEEDYRTPLWIRVLFQSTHRFFVGLPVAFLIVGIAMQFDRHLLKFMQWHGFTVMGKLTYSVYILHMNFVPIVAGSKTQLEHLSFLSLILSYLGIITLTYILSVPFFLMIEAPVTPFIKVLLYSDVKRKKDKLENNEIQDTELDEGKKKLLEESVLESSVTKKCD